MIDRAKSSRWCKARIGKRQPVDVVGSCRVLGRFGARHGRNARRGRQASEVDQVETAPPAPAFHVLAYTPNVLEVRVEVPPGFPSQDVPRMLN